MPTTSNFGWTTPADTDLVKDGAAAIRTLGNGVDSSFVDLKGGTSGQILSKNSDTDLDFVWIANDQGDITAVTAGTGISGGGTSGAVTITNSMATEITAKGDLIVGTGNAAFDNLPAGTNGHVLTADSTVSPTGLKWAAPAAPSFSGVSVKATADQSIANNTEVVLTWDSEVFDTDAYHSNVTNNSRLTVPVGKAGKYQINAQISFDVNGTGRRAISFRKNGTTIKYSPDVVANASIYVGNDLTIIADLAEGDYIELVVYQNSGGNLTCFKAGSPGVNIFEMNYLGA